MMSDIPIPNPPSAPRVAVGLPVRNGENYLGQAIDSILAQTFTDFCLIISDNASDDRTEEICRAYAAKDPRVIYYRQKENIGAAPNFNFVFEVSRSPYFRWAAHDDLIGPDFLRVCAEVLDRDPSLAVAHPRAAQIDAEGNVCGTFDGNSLAGGLSASQRLRWMLWVPEFTEMFGLLRSEVLRRTRLLGGFGGSDRNLLAEILLQGDKGCAPGYHFFRRDHPETLSRSLAPGRHSASAERFWYDPHSRLPVALLWPERLRRYLLAILGAPIPFTQKLACLGVLVERGLRRGVHRLSGRRLWNGRPMIGGPRPAPAEVPPRAGLTGPPPAGRAIVAP